MAGYCLKVESVGDDDEVRTVKMVDLRDFIVNTGVPLSDISALFGKEIQKLLCKYSRLGFSVTKIQVQEKYARVKMVSPSDYEIEYRFWILRTELWD